MGPNATAAARNIDLAEAVMKSPERQRGAINGRTEPDPGSAFIVANRGLLCHKRSLRRPADQGLPWRYPVPIVHFLDKSSTFNALTSILAGTAPFGAHHARGNR